MSLTHEIRLRNSTNFHTVGLLIQQMLSLLAKVLPKADAR